MSESQDSQLKKAGRKLDEVWNFFIKTPLKSSGHFSAECNFCHHSWKRAYVNALQAHLANNCLECPSDIKNYYLGFVNAAVGNEMDIDSDLELQKDQEVKGSKGLKIFMKVKNCLKVKFKQ